MTINLLFLCPHNAAKSVASAAYVGRLSADAGLDVSITTAGTDPDAEVLGVVRDRLESDGFVVDTVPRLVTEQDLETADHIINIGCAHSDLPTSKATTDWDIPNFSVDPAVAFAALESHAAALVESL